MGEMIANLI